MSRSRMHYVIVLGGQYFAKTFLASAGGHKLIFEHILAMKFPFVMGVASCKNWAILLIHTNFSHVLSVDCRYGILKSASPNHALSNNILDRCLELINEARVRLHRHKLHLLGMEKHLVASACIFCALCLFR